MQKATVEAMVFSFAAHCEKHGIPEFMFVFHGGEPLLAPPVWYRHCVAFAHKIFAALPSRPTPTFVIQTNGVSLDNKWCDLFKELGIAVGISLDGTRKDHDHFRKDHAGRGSYDRVMMGIGAAKAAFGGVAVIAVININSDPEETYYHLQSLGISNIHFLLPDANYEQLPPGTEKPYQGSVQDLYAQWLISVFDLWINDTSEQRPGIRIFDHVLRMFWGARPSSDSLGTEKNEVIVIETDGAYESLDSLKICGDGFTKADATVYNASLDDALNSELARIYNLSHSTLCAQCESCDIQEICGGGNLPHRFRAKNGFDNPTVYCHTQAKLIAHVQNAWVDRLPEEVTQKGNLSRISYEDLLGHFASFSRKNMNGSSQPAKEQPSTI